MLSTLERESISMSDFNFSELPGMTCGRMFKITEVMSSYFGNRASNFGSNNMYVNMLSTLYENESRKSSYGDYLKKSDATMTCYNLPISIGRSALLSTIGEDQIVNAKDTLSENNRIGKLSNFSVAGSDEYREELMRDDNFMDEYQDTINIQHSRASS